jgi:hypothetical protein
MFYANNKRPLIVDVWFRCSLQAMVPTCQAKCCGGPYCTLTWTLPGHLGMEFLVSHGGRGVLLHVDTSDHGNSDFAYQEKSRRPDSVTTEIQSLVPMLCCSCSSQSVMV